MTDAEDDKERLERRLDHVRRLLKGPLEEATINRLKQEEIDIVAKLYSLPK